MPRFLDSPRLRQVANLSDLVAYLRDELGWPMIEFRRSGEAKLKEFKDRLQNAKRSLRGGAAPQNTPPVQQPDLWPPGAKRAGPTPIKGTRESP